jgi:hypothetical protein
MSPHRGYRQRIRRLPGLPEGDVLARIDALCDRLDVLIDTLTPPVPTEPIPGPTYPPCPLCGDVGPKTVIVTMGEPPKRHCEACGFEEPGVGPSS